MIFQYFTGIFLPNTIQNVEFKKCVRSRNQCADENRCHYTEKRGMPNRIDVVDGYI